MTLLKVNYTCKICSFQTNDKTKYKRHMDSKRHTNKVENISNSYSCECCKFYTKNKTMFNKHLITKKHISNSYPIINLNFNEKKFNNDIIKYEDLYQEIDSIKSDMNDSNEEILYEENQEVSSSLKILQNLDDLDILENNLFEKNILMKPIKKELKKNIGHYLVYKYFNWGKRHINYQGLCFVNWKKNLLKTQNRIIWNGKKYKKAKIKGTNKYIVIECIN
jgi:hypothetical protein